MTLEDEEHVKHQAIALFLGMSRLTISSSTCGSLFSNSAAADTVSHANLMVVIYKSYPFLQTVSATTSFFLAMQLYPEVQRRAQAELDSIIGSERLPSLDDRDRLPYVSALCDEVLRWMPVAPLGKCCKNSLVSEIQVISGHTGLPHVLSEDDSYSGFYFPKGTVFIPNTW